VGLGDEVAAGLGDGAGVAWQEHDDRPYVDRWQSLHASSGEPAGMCGATLRWLKWAVHEDVSWQRAQSPGPPWGLLWHEEQPWGSDP
jgi:hypothetical protein